MYILLPLPPYLWFSQSILLFLHCIFTVFMVLKSIQRCHSAESPRRMCSRARLLFNCNCPRCLTIVPLRRSRLCCPLAPNECTLADAAAQPRPLLLVLPSANSSCTDFCHRGTTTQNKLIFMGRELKERMHVMHFAPHYSPERVWYLLSTYCFQTSATANS